MKKMGSEDIEGGVVLGSLKTPKAFANFSLGFERSENPGSITNKAIKP